MKTALRFYVMGSKSPGILSFESAFLSHIMLPNGSSVIEHMKAEKLLPAPTGNHDAA